MRGLEAFDEVKRLLVVAAHPDDLETQCGGTIALLAQRGVAVFSLNCTAGDIGDSEGRFSRQALAVMRLAETDAAARALGIKATYNFGLPDGELVADLELRARVARLYRLTQADTVFTFDPFWTGQIHPDHRAAAFAAIDAYMPSKMPLYRPEQLNEAGASLGCVERIFIFSTDRDPDIYIDVTEIYPTKLAASLAHKSQFPDPEQSLDWMKKRDVERGEVIGAQYAEAFRAMGVW